MPLEEDIVALLHERIGFNPASIGPDKLLAAVRSSLEGRDIADPVLFLEGLRRGNQTFQEIVDAVIVPETWFFRDGEPFELVKRYVSDWTSRSKGQVLRCLSLPCSTGEEPYSIAMTLLDHGLEPGRFSIDAVDISPKSLERAKQGIFGAYSFRSADLSFRARYFESRGTTYHLRKMVRERVRFAHGNLLDPLFMNDGRQYDIVFCRNLLIYFDPSAWKVAIKTLDRLLKDTGLLFMGHAEMLDLAAPDFESVRFPGGFAYRKRSRGGAVRPTREAGGRRTPVKVRPKPPAAGRNRVAAPTNLRAQQPEKPVASPAAPESAQGLQRAGELADSGRLVEAEAACAEYLAKYPGSASAYSLLGLIKEADGQTQAAEAHYRRALYFDPKHHETMIHLALLLEGRGDLDGAGALRKRAARARHPA